MEKIYQKVIFVANKENNSFFSINNSNYFPANKIEQKFFERKAIKILRRI